MNQIIRDVFSSPEQVERVIHKVIDYQHTDPEALKKEISEYVVTEHISQNIDKMLDWIEQSMVGNVSEAGAWVSGFYGSGKSSFTKYLGFAFDHSLQIDGQPFADLLATQIDAKTVSQRLKTLVKRINASVVMLDLATQNIGDKPVSDILLLHVRQWAGLSKDEIIAQFEQLVQSDGRWEEMLHVCRTELKREWMDCHDKGIIAKNTAMKLAAILYPGTTFDFSIKDNSNDSGLEKAQKIVDIVRRKSGCESILFLIDEVGQYVGADQNRILDMQGLVQNLRTVGQGKVLVIATAQQTLLDTDAKTAINSPFLVKLKDRFPMQVALESSDIEEICFRRLLKKSPEGEQTLKNLFAASGQRLRTCTSLEKSLAYEVDLTEQSFVRLYPFHPTHFKLLLSLLGELAKGRGGYGLRSAIKVVQDVLTGGHVGGNTADGLINAPLGTMVCGVTLFDILHDDIEAWDRAYMHTVQKTLDAYRENPDYINVAKTLAIANLLPDFHASPKNIAALMQDTVEANTSEQTISEVLRSMAAEKTIPVSDHADGTYLYLNEMQERLDHERNAYQPASSDLTVLITELYREVLKHLQTVQAHESLSVGVEFFEFEKPAAIRSTGGEELRLTLALREAGVSAQVFREKLKTDSLAHPNTVYLSASLPVSMDVHLMDILKSEHMGTRYATDTQARDYAKDQSQKAQRNREILVRLLQQALSEGEMFIRGTIRALSPGREFFEQQIKIALQGLAEKIFDKYGQAAVSMRTGNAKFVLHAAPGKSLELKVDPLKLLDSQSDRLQLNPNAAAASVLDYLGRQEETRGSEFLDRFTRAPFGWAKDVTLYIAAALFAVGKIELNISGRTHKTFNDAVDGVFAAPSAFKNVGVRIRPDQFSEDDLLRCHQFLTNHGVSGIHIRETELWNAVGKFMVQSIADADRSLHLLTQYHLAGGKDLSHLKATLEGILDANLSALLRAINDPEHVLEKGLGWLEKLQKAFHAGLFETIGEVQTLGHALAAYPDKFKVPLLTRYEDLVKTFSLQSFIEMGSIYRQFVSDVKLMQSQAQQENLTEYDKTYQRAESTVDEVADRYELTSDETQELQSALPAKATGLKDFFAINGAITSVLRAKDELESLAGQIRARREPKEKSARKLKVPSIIRDTSSLQELIDELQRLKAQMSEISEITVQLGD